MEYNKTNEGQRQNGGIFKGLRNLFRTKPTEANDPVVYGGDTMASVDGASKMEGETYTAYGKRMCGVVSGNPDSLAPFLQKVYNLERQRQIEDEKQNRDYKDKIKDQINGETARLNSLNNEQNKIADAISDTEDQIGENDEKLAALKRGEIDENKEAKMKLIIGLLIIIPLTIYLFVFYSSTIYSAFLKNWENVEDISLGQTMLDSGAIGNALSLGLGAFLFVIFAPVIFLALGFLLHFFAKEEGAGKYIKCVLIVAVTFMFDCILAYQIAKNLYDVAAQASLDTLPQYDISMAFGDVHVWGVIFCGFIAYIIWGLMFDMVMSAYDDMKSNKGEVERLTLLLSRLKEALRKLNGELLANKNQIEEANANLKTLNNRLSRGFEINLGAIKTELDNFYAGWTTILNALGISQDMILKSNNIHKAQVAILTQKPRQNEKNDKE